MVRTELKLAEKSGAIAPEPKYVANYGSGPALAP